MEVREGAALERRLKAASLIPSLEGDPRKLTGGDVDAEGYILDDVRNVVEPSFIYDRG
jgi:hypothetical protein